MGNVDGYSQPGVGTARVSSSLNAQNQQRIVHNDYVGMSNVRETTTLERCRELQLQNESNVENISRRINAILDRLRGAQPRCGTDASKSDSEGLLGDHLFALERESQLLGALQADLTLLESLL